MRLARNREKQTLRTTILCVVITDGNLRPFVSQIRLEGRMAA